MFQLLILVFSAFDLPGGFEFRWTAIQATVNAVTDKMKKTYPVRDAGWMCLFALICVYLIT